MFCGQDDFTTLNSDDAFVKLLQESGLTVMLTVSLKVIYGCIPLRSSE